MTFVPIGFLKLWDAIDEAGVSLARHRKVEWRSDLRQMDSTVGRGGKTYRTSRPELNLHEAFSEELDKREAESGKRLRDTEVEDIRRDFGRSMGLDALIKLRDEVEHGCRSLLCLGNVPAWVLLSNGKSYPITDTFWGSAEGERLITGCSDKVKDARRGPNRIFQVGGLVVLKKGELAGGIVSLLEPSEQTKPDVPSHKQLPADSEFMSDDGTPAGAFADACRAVAKDKTQQRSKSVKALRRLAEIYYDRPPENRYSEKIAKKLHDCGIDIAWKTLKPLLTQVYKKMDQVGPS